MKYNVKILRYAIKELKHSSIMSFYKQIIVWSFSINIVLLIFYQGLLLTLSTKFFALILLFLFYKDHLDLVKLPISKHPSKTKFLKLFIGNVFLDLAVSSCFILIIKEFI